MEGPAIERPEEPEETIYKDTKGNNVTEISEFDKAVYVEQVKQYAKDMSNFKTTTRTLYKVIYAQCRKVMQ